MVQELSQWRQQQLQESLRNSVLDEEAAAKFSTAAALAAKEKRNQMAKANYDKGLLTAVDNLDTFQEVLAAFLIEAQHMQLLREVTGALCGVRPGTSCTPCSRFTGGQSYRWQGSALLSQSTRDQGRSKRAPSEPFWDNVGHMYVPGRFVTLQPGGTLVNSSVIPQLP